VTTSPDKLFIVCDNLVKIYKAADLEVVALQGLDLVIAEGEMLGIVGASGSGKSTLLNILGGLDRPSAGRISVDGRDFLKLSDRALDGYRRTVVGFVWQQVARNLVPYLTAQENVELPMTVAGTGLPEKRKRSRELLEAVGLWEHRRHRLAQLSGGQQQRVAIAVALANRPRLLLADEPTGEVDSATAQGLLDLLRELNRGYGLTTIIVTHDPQIARQVDRVVAIRDGRTSTETIRRVGRLEPTVVSGPQREGSGVGQEAVDFHEYVVLDAVGRLQVPKKHLEQFGIRGRATLEVTDEGILIRPVAGPALGFTPHANQLEKEEPSALQRRGLRSWWTRARRR
jgi:ABC-type lipoprotein export system ATPase subunit